MGGPHCGHPGHPAPSPKVARAALEPEMVRNHRFFNKNFNRPGTPARTRPGAPPMAKKWPEQRWRRKWSEIIDSLIESLIGQGHRPELGQEPRP